MSIRSVRRSRSDTQVVKNMDDIDADVVYERRRTPTPTPAPPARSQSSSPSFTSDSDSDPDFRCRGYAYGYSFDGNAYADGGILYMRPLSRSNANGNGAPTSADAGASGSGGGGGGGASPGPVSPVILGAGGVGSPGPVSPLVGGSGSPHSAGTRTGTAIATGTSRPTTYPYQYQNRYATTDPYAYPHTYPYAYPSPSPRRAFEEVRGRGRGTGRRPPGSGSESYSESYNDSGSGSGSGDESESVRIPVHGVGDLESEGGVGIGIDNDNDNEKGEGGERARGMDGEKLKEKAKEGNTSMRSAIQGLGGGVGVGAAFKTESQQQQLRRHGHSFFSEELKGCRTAYLKLVARATALTVLLIWAVLPIYWGSLSSPLQKTGNLEVWVINRDQARIGDSLEAAVLSAPSTGVGALWWRVLHEDHFPDEDSVIQGVVDERTWAAVVVNANATDNLSAARSAGDDTYNPASAISVYYAQARNEIATGTYLLPLLTQFLSNFTTNYSTGSAQRYLAAIVASDGSVNVTAINGIAQAPQTIAPGVSFEVHNVRPYTTPEAQAPLLVGQIYLCIFAFIIVMAHTTARSLISPYLTLPSYLILRILTPLIIYFPLSLSYALISVAFKLPFNGGQFSYARGFMAFFGFVYLGMAALGLALEAMVTILGPRFVPFFLVLLIIVNVSTCALPPDLQSSLYSYGAGFQFWNIQQATRTIFFDTYNHMGKNAGILIAWVLISCCTTALFTWFVRYLEFRRMYRDSRDGERIRDRNKNRNRDRDRKRDRNGHGGKDIEMGDEEKGGGKSDGKGKEKVVDEEYGRPTSVDEKDYDYDDEKEMDYEKGREKSSWLRRRELYRHHHHRDENENMKDGKDGKGMKKPKAKSSVLGLSARERWERMKNSCRDTNTNLNASTNAKSPVPKDASASAAAPATATVTVVASTLPSGSGQGPSLPTGKEEERHPHTHSRSNPSARLGPDRGEDTPPG